MSLCENTIAYQVTIHRWGIKRQVPPVVLEGMMPGERELIKKKMLSASKRIIESKEYDQIVSQDGYTTRWLQERSVPSILKKGVYCIPTLLCSEIDSYMEDYKYTRSHGLVPVFVEVYREQAYAARDLLGSALFDALEYPTEERMSQLFSIETQYITFDVPSQLKTISEELFKRERERVEQGWRDAEEAVNQLLLSECIELVSNTQKALQGLADGTLKRFRDANISNLLEWSELFLRARNVTDNTELAQVVESIKALLQGVGHNDVKFNIGGMRDKVNVAMSSIQIDLKGMMEELPDRAIYLE